MKKIGIITLYHNSTNFGGILQAYALCKILTNHGIKAEQIAFDSGIKKSNTGMRNKIYGLLNLFCNNTMLVSRQKKFAWFREYLIPHSKKVYTDLDISECNKIYDMFITGSDQVWNLGCFNENYFLKFADRSKTTLSYAASLGRSFINEDEKKIYRKYLHLIEHISVREEDAKSILGEITKREIQVVLDPTLLLDEEKWNELSSDIVINEPYIFCYFIGVDFGARKLAEDFAKEKILKLITIPHVDGFNRADIFFHAKKLYSADLKDFISLIKNAQYILTDSFHGSVFSAIYKKQYFVVPRIKKDMNSRIRTLMELFDSHEHFCDSQKKRTVRYLTDTMPIDYRGTEERLNILKEQSLSFLMKRINEKGNDTK